MSKDKALKEYIKKVLQEQKLLLSEAAIEDTPTNSTGLNRLVSVLKIILPTLESSFKSLMTSEAQRSAFRKYILKSFIDSLAPQEMLSAEIQESKIRVAPTTPAIENIVEPLNELDELEAQKDPSKFIDVTGEEEKRKKEAEKEQQTKEKQQEKLKLAADEKATKPFPEIEGENATGRDEAVDAYKKTIDTVIRAFRRLHDEPDKKVFKEYLVTNLLLYFDKWSSDISPNVPDISTPEYEKQKADIASFSPSENGGNSPQLQESLSAQILKSLQDLKIV